MALRALNPQSKTLRAALTYIARAGTAVKMCTAYINGIRTGNDVAGSARIHSCLDQTALNLRRASLELSPLTRYLAEPRLTAAFSVVLRSAPSGEAALKSAATDIDNVNLSGAYRQVLRAAADVTLLANFLKPTAAAVA